MSQKRKIIRNKTVDLLKSSTAAGLNVFASRTIPVNMEDLPAINVYTQNDLYEEYGTSPLEYKVTSDLICEIICSGALNDAEVNDAVDDISTQIISKLGKEDGNTKGELGCYCDRISLTSSSTEYEYNGDASVIHTRMVFKVIYSEEITYDDLGSPEDLDRFGVDWDVGTANDPDPEAKDLIELGTP